MQQVSRAGRRFAVVAVLAIGIASCGGGGGDGGSEISGRGEARAERGLSLGAPIDVGDRPVGIMRGPGGLWVASTPVTVIEPQSREVREQVEVPEARAVTVTEHTSWIPGVSGAAKGPGQGVGSGEGAIAEIDVHSFRVRSYVPVGGDPKRITVGGASVWMTDAAAPGLTRLDVDTARILSMIPLEVVPGEVAYGVGAVWVASHDDDPCRCVVRVDALAGEAVATVDLGSDAEHITGLVVTGTAVWITATRGEGGQSTGLLIEVDPETNEVVGTTELGRSASGVAAGGGTVWVTDCLAGTLTGVDEATGGTVRGPTEVGEPAPEGAALYSTEGSCPAALAAVHDVVWVANRNDGTVVPVTRAD